MRRKATHDWWGNSPTYGESLTDKSLRDQFAEALDKAFKEAGPVTPTGRFSIQEPVLQNIPIRVAKARLRNPYQHPWEGIVLPWDGTRPLLDSRGDKDDEGNKKTEAQMSDAGAATKGVDS